MVVYSWISIRPKQFVSMLPCIIKHRIFLILQFSLIFSQSIHIDLLQLILIHYTRYVYMYMINTRVTILYCVSHYWLGVIILTHYWLGDSLLTWWLTIDLVTHYWLGDSLLTWWLTIDLVTHYWLGDSLLTWWLTIDLVTHYWLGDSLLTWWLTIDLVTHYWLGDSLLTWWLAIDLVTCYWLGDSLLTWWLTIDLVTHYWLGGNQTAVAQAVPSLLTRPFLALIGECLRKHGCLHGWCLRLVAVQDAFAQQAPAWRQGAVEPFSAFGGCFVGQQFVAYPEDGGDSAGETGLEVG